MRPPLTSMKPLAIASPSPEPWWPVSASASGRRAGRPAPARRARSPAPVDDPHAHALTHRRAPVPRRACPRSSARRSRARSRTRARAAPASAWSGGSSRSIESWKDAAGAPVSSTASCSTSSSEHQVRARSMLPACSSERSSSFSISSHRRVAASSTSSRTSATFSASGSLRVERARRGEDRRDGRAQVVGDRAQHGRLHLVAAAQRCRLDDLRPQARAVERGREDRLSAGTTRSRARSRSAGDTPAGSSSAPIVSPPARSGSSAASDGGASPRRIDAEGVPSACASRSAAGASASPRRSAPSSSCASSLASVGLTAALVELTRARARELGDQTDRDRDGDEGREADPVAAVASVKCPTGGRWKKLNAAALRTAVASPKARPQKIDTTTHRQQVEDAERLDRRDVLERVDEQRRDGDRRERHQHPERARRALGAKEAGRERREPIAPNDDALRPAQRRSRARGPSGSRSR